MLVVKVHQIKVKSSNSSQIVTPLKTIFLNHVSNLRVVDSVCIGTKKPLRDVSYDDAEDEADDLYLTDGDFVKEWPPRVSGGLKSLSISGFCVQSCWRRSNILQLVSAYWKALISIKVLFSNVVNVLLDWDEDQNDDLCSWRGIPCDNISTTVVALYSVAGKQDKPECGVRVFRKMKQLKVAPHIRTYELLFSLFGKVNARYERGNILSQADAAKRINAIEGDMVRNGIQHSYLSIRNLFVLALEDFDEALTLLNQACSEGIQLDALFFNEIIEAASRKTSVVPAFQILIKLMLFFRREELFVNTYTSSRDHRREIWNISNRVIRGGHSRWQHEG